jgi:outer membrane protein assembly factor BamB
MFLAIDDRGNTFATGKARTLFSFAPNGTVRWSYRVPDHTSGTGAISKDGSRVALGSVGGWLYYLDGNSGQVLWRKKLTDENAGHNGVSMSADGKYITVGAGPANHLAIFDENGTILYENTAPVNPDPMLNLKFATAGDVSEGTQHGIMGTYTSPDGSKIFAAYADNYVRMFERENVSAQGGLAG